jgi:chromosome segregation protein
VTDLDDGRIAPPRLLALRVQGFKSFAERTNVEFGGGISAVVGPNGSGKSNLADALRWALGEQGRALRSRKAEDVIWAGSERRAAQGMADVTLVLDNVDGLLPVDFQVLELGRRLYRSGENEYLLNKQRIRLRDLVDLLDSAHLADNAFLFIGQGMVDQALALRPEERRPLFEEVAGVRRHERRRRKAEERLVESEANLARVEDIVAELRPQARRLAAQAEQQATRTDVGDELASALLAATHARWHDAAARLAAAETAVGGARADADVAMNALDAAETVASGLASELAARATAEQDRREAHETARTRLTDLQLRDGRAASELEAVARDRRRLIDERASAEAEVATRRRETAIPVPERDHDLEADVATAERELADALAELGVLRSASKARGDELAAVRRAEAAREVEAETARRRLAEAQRRATDEAAAAATAGTRLAEVSARLEDARVALARALEVEATGLAEQETARTALEAAEAARAAAADRLATATAAAAALRGRLEVLAEQLAEEERRPIARAARRAGGRRLDEDLAVEPGLRAAVEAALADRARAYLVAAGTVAELATERGRVVVEERARAAAPTPDAATRRYLDAVASAGGGRLADAVRRDPTGGAGRLLERAVWLPDLGACLDLQDRLPPGWIAVPRDGGAVVDELGVTLGAPESILERRAEHDRLGMDVVGAEAGLAELRTALGSATEAADAARSTLETARTSGSQRAAERRQAEDIERTVAREAESAAREAAWHAAQAERLRAEVDRTRSEADALAGPAMAAAPTADQGDTGPGEALAVWEARAAELRERRDRLAERLSSLDAERRTAEHDRARAEAAAAHAEDRIARADRDALALTERESSLVADRDRLRADLAEAAEAESAARAALAELHAADAADRTRLAEAERDATAARERLRAADERLRVADRGELEARLALESLREGVLVELAGLGALGLASLGVDSPAHDEADEAVADDTAALEAALAAAAEQWAAEPPPEMPPTSGRLAQLRRRYHELGAANPYAVEEYAELRTRLETLETQAADLHGAIAGTRSLIAELDAMIAEQFRSTFAALETAFERRFEQLFGGGFARLSLTDPSDLGSTGVEIVARPPGKKAQALAMLSGGERALTAVALLFAMLEVRPVPFCVLDEVDAALDEANIGRFADALRSLADTTQFIVITHNRGTIEMADALYGVTVGDDSVSRVISLRLEEAQALASERRRELGVAG